MLSKPAFEHAYQEPLDDEASGINTEAGPEGDGSTWSSLSSARAELLRRKAGELAAGLKQPERNADAAERTEYGQQPASPIINVPQFRYEAAGRQKDSVVALQE